MRWFITIALVLSLLAPQDKLWAQDNIDEETGGGQSTAMREFIMSCTYGVLAGTLVGAAMLAFTDQPGDNLNKVARGASLGLYAGIMLGVYVVYIVPGQLEQNEDYLIGLPPPEDEARNRLQVFPMISERGVDGVGAIWNVMNF